MMTLTERRVIAKQSVQKASSSVIKHALSHLKDDNATAVVQDDTRRVRAVFKDKRLRGEVEHHRQALRDKHLNLRCVSVHPHKQRLELVALELALGFDITLRRYER